MSGQHSPTQDKNQGVGVGKGMDLLKVTVLKPTVWLHGFMEGIWWHCIAVFLL